MKFEFDPAKSAANKAKHGIDFVDAQALWKVEAFETDAHSEIEARVQRIAKLGEAVWTAYYTMRGDRVRLISVRRARSEEKASYEARGES